MVRVLVFHMGDFEDEQLPKLPEEFLNFSFNLLNSRLGEL